MKKSTLLLISAVTCLLAGWLIVRTAAPLARAAALLANPLALVTRVSPAAPALLTQVRSLQRLETCRYRGQTVVRGDTRGALPTWLAGDRLLLVADGEVVAGVDLEKLRAEDIAVRGPVVSIRLPEPEVFHTRLDTTASRVYERQSGVFTGPDPDLERRVRLEAEAQIRRAALDGGVLTSARKNAQESLRGQLTALGFSDVRFL